VIPVPAYDPKKDGNVFSWVLRAAQVRRELKRIEANVAKETAAESERLDPAKVEN
jgi:hypothetical protein